MSPAFVVDLLLGVPLASLLIVVGVRRALDRSRPPVQRSPLAHFAVAGLAINAIDWFSADWLDTGADDPFWVGGVMMMVWLVLLLTFPDGIPRPRWTGWMLVGFVVLDIYITASGAVPPVLIPVVIAAIAVGIGSQLWRYGRRASVQERDAVRWALIGLLPFVAYCLGMAIARALPWSASETLLQDPVLQAIDVFVFWLVPYSAAVGLLAPSTQRVDRVLHGVIVIAGTGFTLGVAFALVQALVGPTWSTVLVVALVWPVGALLRRAGARLVYGRARRPALSALATRLEQTLGADEVSRALADAVVRELALPFAAVTGAAGEVRVGHPIAGLEPETFVVYFRGEPVGSIAASPRAGEVELTSRDRTLLTKLAGESGPALYAEATLGELRTARERVVFAREEERRTLRRELHDDLAPTLAGLSLKAAAAEALQLSDPARSGTLVHELESALRTASDQARDLAYGLRPQILDDSGLVEAIVDRVASPPGSSLSVVVTAAPESMVLPAAIELAALRIVQEAVANVRRHSGASGCTVKLDLVDRELYIEVSDNGVGMPQRVGAGIGLSSMQERADELGGSLRIESTQEGTKVTVLLPVKLVGEDAA